MIKGVSQWQKLQIEGRTLELMNYVMFGKQVVKTLAIGTVNGEI